MWVLTALWLYSPWCRRPEGRPFRERRGQDWTACHTTEVPGILSPRDFRIAASHSHGPTFTLLSLPPETATWDAGVGNLRSTKSQHFSTGEGATRHPLIPCSCCLVLPWSLVRPQDVKLCPQVSCRNTSSLVTKA